MSTGDAASDRTWGNLWDVSIRTLVNCMHDCYEDCPFYEQLQYAMDTRSSCLFTYSVAGDDRLARQAIVQIHNSFQSRVGLTASRAPTHRVQFIPHFSLYWVNMVNDHLMYYNDKKFVSRLLPVIDSIISYFSDRIGHYGLITSETLPGIWNFVDWTCQWRPHGIPPSIGRVGVSTYTNQLYAYTLKNAANLVSALGRPAIAAEYHAHAVRINEALNSHCFDGQFFADTLASEAEPTDYSQHCQVWAVLSGAVVGPDAQKLLRKSLQYATAGKLVKESVSQSFYTMRALSLAGGDVYKQAFYDFWKPWHQQLALNVTTWVEDDVSQRSDCHVWGSVPIYEFLVEVAGIRPAEPGWGVIEFRPRISIFKELEVTIPIGVANGDTKGLVHVTWATTGEAHTKISLKLELFEKEEIPVRIILPGHLVLSHSPREWRLIVKSS